MPPRNQLLARTGFFGVPAIVFLTGCISWRSDPVSPQELIARRKPPVIRITQNDSTRVILRHPVIQGDTVYGELQASLADEPAGRTGVPLAEVKAIETRRSDPTKTTLLLVGAGVAGFTALCLAEALGCGEEPVFAAAP